MENKRPNKRFARIFVTVTGPVVSVLDSLSPGGKNTWTPNLFPSLGAICRSGRYEVVLLDNLKNNSSKAETLVTSVSEVLSHQGIVIDHLIKPDSHDIEPLKKTTDFEHSYVIASNQEVEKFAELLAVKTLSFSDWQSIEEFLLEPPVVLVRKAAIVRNTKETKISLNLNIDGSGDAQISTGLPFFDHMLEQIARHARFDINLKCDGDLDVDEHHTVEDTAIVLGQAIAKALGDKRGISRYGFEILPMDDCLAEVALDFSGRAWFVWYVDFSRDVVGTFPTELFSHFFKSFSDEAKCNLHMTVNAGNAHHQAEALFKAFARALRSVVFRYPGNNDLPSTKGVL